MSYVLPNDVFGFWGSGDFECKLCVVVFESEALVVVTT